MKTRRHRVPFFMMNEFKNRISMRISPLHMLLCLAWLISLPSQAQTDSCEKASNKDQQVICMAISKKEIKLCEGVHRQLLPLRENYRQPLELPGHGTGISAQRFSGFLTGRKKATSAPAANPCNCRAPPPPPCRCSRPAWVGVNGFTEIHRVCAHLDGQCDFAKHVARMRADHTAARNLPWPCASGELSNSSLVTPSSRPFAIARPEAVHGNRPFLTLMPWTLAWSSVKPTQATTGSV
jgi:hypothetical protein